MISHERGEFITALTWLRLTRLQRRRISHFHGNRPMSRQRRRLFVQPLETRKLMAADAGVGDWNGDVTDDKLQL